MKREDRKLMKFLEKLPPQAAFYIKSGNPPRFFAFFTLNGAKTFLEGGISGKGNIFDRKTGQQVG